jgi:hypothetical protein
LEQHISMNCLGYYNDVYAIDFDALPSQFVIKAVHGSSTNMIVTDKSTLDMGKTRKKLQEWMVHDQYRKVGFEWAYKNIKPGLVIEKYLDENNKCCLTDYKFACFNGKVKYVQIILDIEGKQVQAFYDSNFNLLPFNRKNRDSYIKPIIKPEKFDEMHRLAEILADQLPYVRVDFYLVDNRIIFGEMTFYPGDGRHDFYPDAYNKIIGDYLTLPQLKKNQSEITTYKG